MRRDSLAQLILSLATTPDRAASTIGDLVEESSTRGSLWFWSNVLSTACSLCWRDFCSAPLRMLGLGLWGYFAALFWGIAPLAPIGLLVLVVRPNPNPPTNPLLVVPLLVASEIFGALMAGCEVAKSSRGRELAAAFSVTFMFAANYALAECLSAMQPRRVGKPLLGHEHALAQDCLEVFFVLLGAVLFRLSKRTESIGGAHA